MSTTRLESFSDGVLAVAITLLVLDIKVPAIGGRSHQTLAHALLADWPHYAAYATSFLTIGIIWVNHHAMIGRLRETDHAILMLNLVLLLTIGVIPFATALFAAFLRHSHGQNLAAGMYAGVFLVMSVAFASLNRHILFRKTHLLKEELEPDARRQILVRSVSGILPYVLATALAAVSAYLSLAITAAIAIYYALPIASSSQPSQPIGE
jgi:uncharacterized membrane protein